MISSSVVWVGQIYQVLGWSFTGENKARGRDKRRMSLPPGAGYRRLENQLYRIEIHKGGKSLVAMLHLSGVVIMHQ